MGLIARVLDFARIVQNFGDLDVNTTDVKIDSGGGANATAKHFGAPGDDAFPLQSDYVATIPVQGSGRLAAVGYADPLNIPVAQEGDRRIYSRDPTDGTPSAQVWIKSDGTIIVDNGSGSLAVEPGGTVTINGVTIDTDGNISTPGDIDSDGTITGDVDVIAGTVSGNAHIHAPGTYNIGGAPVVGVSAVPTP